MIQSARTQTAAYDEIETFFRERFTTDNPLITEAVKRMLAAGGKRLRPQITLLAAQAAGSSAQAHLELAAYMELIHVATLIHDDVVDRAIMRRGVNATAVDYGNRISVLAGDYLFAWIFKNVTDRYAPPIPNILSTTLAAICDGEVLQLRSLGDLDLTLGDYVEIVTKKTATLFSASAECGAIAGGADSEEVAALREYGLAYGIAFQMRDDLLDVTAQAGEVGKPVGNDLTEQKVTIPLIFALRRAGDDFRALAARYYKDGKSASVGRLLEGIRGSGAAEETRAQIREYARRAGRALAPLPETIAKAELRHLAETLV